MSKMKVLFLCIGNSARSQMAEAFLTKYGGDQFQAYSAGMEPRGIHPYTERVMKEVGIDLKGHSSKHIKEYMGKVNFAHVVILCEEVEELCPTIFPGLLHTIHWSFEDPSTFMGSDEEKLVKFRKVRDEIEERIKAWLSDRSQKKKSP